MNGRSAYILSKQRLPRQAPKLNTVIRLIAGLGGFLGCKCDGEPDMQTLWLWLWLWLGLGLGLGLERDVA